ncbi:MAG: S9 family peptidase [Oscillospiraceae bacterium]
MKKVDYEHFGRFKFPCSVSACGEDIYFTVKEADFDENKYKSNLYVISSGVQKKLTSSGDVAAYYLMEDGVVFPALRLEKDKEAAKNKRQLTVFQKLPYDGGEAQEWLRVDKNIGEAAFLSDTGFIFTALYSHSYEAALKSAEGDVDKALAVIKDDGDYAVMDEIPFWFNGEGMLNKIRARLYMYDKGEITALTDEFTNISILALSKSKRTAILSANSYTDKMMCEDKLLSLDIASKVVTDISFDGCIGYYGAGFINDDELCVVGQKDREYGMSENPIIYRYNLVTKKAAAVYDKGEHAFGNSVGSDVKMGRAIPAELMIRDEKLYLLDTQDDTAAIICVDLKSGEIHSVTKERGSVNEAVFFNDGFAAIAMRGDMGCEVYKIGMDGAETALSSMNSALCAEYETVTPMDLTFTNKHGVEIRGFVMKPVNAKKGEKYPTILDIHGGPKTVYGGCYFHEMQLWAGMGYAVIFCNPTGSDGKGDEFSDIRGKYGTVDYEDIMQFCDEAIARCEFIDANKMGVTGGSYGGFMTNWIIGHTNRFKAAASQRSIANWTSFQNMSDIGYYFAADQCKADMWQENGFEKMWEHSPVKYANQCSTPTLFIHSEEDFRCPSAEGIQMFTALKINGVQARLCMFKGENHELSRSGKPKHRVRRLMEITQWFDKYLKA